ncbi:MAG: SDR family oxidoreductase [Gammaproteobacteria bacterium]|nr:SDR family oxidoreductase [Gammaproteobacteria bacterium]MCP5199060.1 SDR family oxidoreductase [Gammaproteobacteria bacterium]
MGRLEGKIAMVTGAGTGIGRACMVMFAREGATVFGVSRTQANLDETLRQVEAAGGQGSVFSADLADPALAEGAVNECVNRYGRIDILLNAAGVGYNLRETSEGSMDPIDTTPIDKWREVMALNLDSLFYVTRIALRHMKAAHKGSIVNVASIFGLGGAPDAHTYTATKGAIINLTRSMSVAYVDDNIRCNVVAPGFVQTQMVESVIPMLFSPENPKLIAPMGRPASPEEVAYACLYLASDEASYCTGTVLCVDGGSTARA